MVGGWGVLLDVIAGKKLDAVATSLLFAGLKEGGIVWPVVAFCKNPVLKKAPVELVWFTFCCFPPNLISCPSTSKAVDQAVWESGLYCK